MFRIRTCCLLAALLYCLSLSGQEEPEKREMIHILNAYRMRGFTQDDGRTVTRLLKNVQLMHNEYLMQCDSANYFPGTNSFEAFGNIMIYKDKTFLYGETLHYDGNTSIAQVRGKIVRLVDDQTVLRTFFLDFNTKQNVGYFYGGGTMDDKENVLESDKGYYYSNEKLARFVDKVEMRNKDYDIYSDSLHYYTNREFAVFLGPTNIWHKDGFLSCEDGWYDKPRDYFHFAKKAYVLSEDQEMWADSIFYDRVIEKCDLYGNIQVLDTTRSVLAFGDEGHFLNETNETWLMRHPSVAYYEVDDDGKSDTLFLRADTLHFQRIPNPAYYVKDTTNYGLDSLSNAGDSLDIYHLPLTIYHLDSLSNAGDSLDIYHLPFTIYHLDSLSNAGDSLTRHLLLSLPRASEGVTSHEIDSLLNASDALTRHLPPVTPYDSDNYELRITNYGLDSLQQVNDTLTRHLLPVTSHGLDSLQQVNDSLTHHLPPVTSHDLDSLSNAGDTLVPVIDSVLQYFFAYRNVRIFRSDAQGACDSLVYFVNDSLGLMYRDPVLWNDENQITSDSMRFISKNQELLRAEFLSSAFIVAELDSMHYNQIKGRNMYGYFRDNELYLLDVEANVQTVFFMTEENIITNVILGESKNMQIFVKERKMSRVKYIDSPVIPIHPLDLLPESQQQLKGLNWREAERPKTRYEVCDREVWPSQRAETELLQRPTFPITAKIDNTR